MNDKEFDKHLQSFDNVEPLSTGFRGEVWRRIELADSGGFGFRSWIEGHLFILARPLFAAVSIVLMILAGLALGLSTAPKKKDLRSTYVETISPFMTAHQK